MSIEIFSERDVEAEKSWAYLDSNQAQQTKKTFIQLDILRVLSKNGALQIQVISEEDPRSLYIVSPSIQIYQ